MNTPKYKLLSGWNDGKTTSCHTGLRRVEDAKVRRWPAMANGGPHVDSTTFILMPTFTDVALE